MGRRARERSVAVMFVKICGIRESEHLATCIDVGADAVGFLMSPSPRQVSVATTARLVRQAADHILSVAVFADEPIDYVRDVIRDTKVRAVQLHGTYRREDFAALADSKVTVIRAVAGHDTEDLDCGSFGEDILIVDSRTPGAGEPWDVGALPVSPTGRWMLAGGLGPATVTEAVRSAKPWGVDVSSGVESSRGVKDSALIARFCELARAA